MYRNRRTYAAHLAAPVFILMCTAVLIWPDAPLTGSKVSAQTTPGTWTHCAEEGGKCALCQCQDFGGRPNIGGTPFGTHPRPSHLVKPFVKTNSLAAPLWQFTAAPKTVWQKDCHLPWRHQQAAGRWKALHFPPAEKSFDSASVPIT